MILFLLKELGFFSVTIWKQGSLRGVVVLVSDVAQFYPWFKFCFLLFSGIVMYDNDINHNIYDNAQPN